MIEEKTESTPLMKQYWQIKDQYKHAILFFRLGDFYEMFGEDAKTAAKVLSLYLTKRGDIPMCGIPYHSAAGYISKLLKAGFKIAICEQTTPASPTKNKLVERKVIRVITPGTVMTEDLLDSKNANHLVTIEADLVGWGLACIEVSTGEFWAQQTIGDSGLNELASLLARISPSEIVASDIVCNKLFNAGVLSQQGNITNFDCQISKLAVPSYWPHDERWLNYPLALKAALKAEKYITANEPNLEGKLRPALNEGGSVLVMDENAINSLELVNSEGGRKHTLWGMLDKTHTAMGSRLLKKWLLNPLTDIPRIKKRQLQISELVNETESRERLTAALKNVSDIERVLSRSIANSTTPSDIAGLKKSLSHLEEINEWLKNSHGAFTNTALSFEDVYPALMQLSVLLDKAVSDNPPVKLADGNFIKLGYNSELDALRNLRENSGQKLQELCENEKQKTGILSLKAGYNSVFGYFLEITNPNLSKVPSNYIRKQTLTNSERFITEELKELESAILGAEERISALENHLFNEIKNEITTRGAAIKTFASLIAELDVLNSLAENAVEHGFVMPEIDLSCDIEIIKGRHPVAQANLPHGTFVPNDIHIGANGCSIMIITGPNMSGKSVYLKQNALIALMAQTGSFVPAESARIGLVDRIMTRIGAHDAISKGQSTFMVEMKETATILNSLTQRSLVLLDEVGRGTSTFDGISIAWAVVEYLASCEQKPRIMFATHYFELTELEDKYEGVKNFNIEVKEWENKNGKTELIFMHKIGEGPADKSYGIHVAAIAGLPMPCIIRAKKILSSLEEKNEYPVSGVPSQAKLPMFGNAAIIDEIRLTNPDKMTPLEASMLITQWKQRIENEH